MKTSIRKFLLVNLLLAITATTTLTAIGNYYLDQKDIQEHLDTLMAISALSYQTLLGTDLHQRSLETIQKNLEAIPRRLEAYYPHTRSKTSKPKYFLNKFTYQVWTNDGKLLLHSPSAPGVSLASSTEGFSDKVIDDERWRVFTTRTQHTGVHTVLAEQYDTRNELGQRVARDDLYIMLLTFPLSGILIWIIIGQGLASFRKIADALANRKPNYLEPVSLKHVPSEIKPVIDELNKLFKRLQEGFAREQRFAADAAHELRTPLAALKTHAQVALNSDNLDEKNEALKKLIHCVNRSTHVIQQLLIMSRLVPDASSENTLSDVHINQVARETLVMLAPAALENHVELEFNPGKSIPSFLGNDTAISILIRNLVDNAIRYCQMSTAHVIVRTHYDKKSVILEVEDNGPGIPDALKNRVFERFYRVLGNKKTGSGLGLSIVKEICALHQADISLRTPEDNTGLIVTIHFPIEPTQ